MLQLRKRVGVDDMTHLKSVNETDIANNLKTRLSNNQIFTYISDVLISVNPFENIPGLFNDEKMESYIRRYMNEVPPHIFAVAERAFRNLQNKNTNQCIIVQGESGSGKTEACKALINYISYVSGSGNEVLRVKKIILQSSPLLEAFGNAKTLRNNNSSRFGKYFSLQFDRQGNPLGGEISLYLLEKSRICNVARGERSFHIFYQLLKGADPKLKEQLGLIEMEDYNFLSHSNCYEIEGMNDKEKFLMTVFSENGTSTKVINKAKALTKCAKLLSIEEHALETYLTKKHILVEGKEIETQFNSIQAKNARDALSKLIYERIFHFIAGKINESMKCSKFDCTIDILDIYGFESFENNSFEQLIINFVNEKLQNIFSSLVLRKEQDEYKSEGVPWNTISFSDNKAICDLIELSNPPGILSILDGISAYYNLESYNADQRFLDSLSTIISRNKYFTQRSSNHFILDHFAGPICYNVHGFTEKNKEFMTRDLICCMQSTKDPLLKGMFSEIGTDFKKRPSTASFKILKNIDDLMKSISERETHYIKCIKPNDSKSPKTFDSKTTIQQIRHHGLKEIILLRRSGYFFRTTFQDFFNRYKYLLVTSDMMQWRGSAEQGCMSILNDCNISKSDYFIGKTKIFLRNPLSLAQLDELLERFYHTKATIISKAFRKYKHRQYLKSIQNNSITILSNNKQRRRMSINRNFKGDYIQFFNNAQLQELLQPYQHEGGVVFSDEIRKPKVKVFRSEPSFKKMMLLVTPQSIFFIRRKKDEPRRAGFTVKKRVPFTQIENITMSSLPDNWLCLKLYDDVDIFFENEHKTELVTILDDIYFKEYGNHLKLLFSNQFEFDYTKRKTKSVEFITDGTISVRFKSTITVSKTGNFQITATNDLPPGTVPYLKTNNSSNMGRKSVGLGLNTLESCPKLKPVVGNGLASPESCKEIIRPGHLSEEKDKSVTRLLVLYDYHPVLDDELNIRDGDVIALLKTNDDGWGYGRLLSETDGRKEGYFPLNFTMSEEEFAQYYSNPEIIR
ncbi:hypothetical protein C9374_004954 [Naegleria lovaniensis]|uniref:Uncharacterized protein n=1 Tax=Naegleria lovaniensis TaxID=51637 RepID=A0AA88GRG7_NAELO|nr:uncharacterized protein C9374_004954 [Naegleria lovaniensis]KAG2382987.1 hypothetical protein C9374_004954 [Naegleria lovaniensis]